MHIITEQIRFIAPWMTFFNFQHSFSRDFPCPLKNCAWLSEDNKIHTRLNYPQSSLEKEGLQFSIHARGTMKQI